MKNNSNYATNSLVEQNEQVGLKFEVIDFIKSLKNNLAQKTIIITSNEELVNWIQILNTSNINYCCLNGNKRERLNKVKNLTVYCLLLVPFKVAISDSKELQNINFHWCFYHHLEGLINQYEEINMGYQKLFNLNVDNVTAFISQGIKNNVDILFFVLVIHFKLKHSSLSLNGLSNLLMGFEIKKFINVLLSLIEKLQYKSNIHQSQYLKNNIETIYIKFERYDKEKSLYNKIPVLNSQLPTSYDQMINNCDAKHIRSLENTLLISRKCINHPLLVNTILIGDNNKNEKDTPTNQIIKRDFQGKGSLSVTVKDYENVFQQLLNHIKSSSKLKKEEKTLIYRQRKLFYVILLN